MADVISNPAMIGLDEKATPSGCAHLPREPLVQVNMDMCSRRAFSERRRVGEPRQQMCVIQNQQVVLALSNSAYDFCRESRRCQQFKPAAERQKGVNDRETRNSACPVGYGSHRKVVAHVRCWMRPKP